MNPLEAHKISGDYDMQKSAKSIQIMQQKKIVYSYRKARKCLAKVGTIAQK
jgi:hypothetical protein